MSTSRLAVHVALPQLSARLADLPANLQRGVYDAFALRVRYDRTTHSATLHATITADALPTITTAARAATGGNGPPPAAQPVRMLSVPPAGLEPALERF